MENKQILFKNRPFYLLISILVNCLIKLIIQDVSYFYLGINVFLCGILLQYLFNTIEFRHVIKGDQMEIMIPFWQIRVYLFPAIYFVIYMMYNFNYFTQANDRIEGSHYYGLLLMLIFYTFLTKIEIPAGIGNNAVIINKQVISIKSIVSIEVNPIKNKKNINLIKVFYGDNNAILQTVLSKDYSDQFIDLYTLKAN